jgi:hypothetical protein
MSRPSPPAAAAAAGLEFQDQTLPSVPLCETLAAAFVHRPATKDVGHVTPDAFSSRQNTFAASRHAMTECVQVQDHLA